MFKEKNQTKFLLFYIVIIYVFAFLFWWSYLLYTKTEQHYTDALKYNILKFQVEKKGNTDVYFQTEEFLQLKKKFERQKVMIQMEGAVFFIILLMGMLKIRQSFQQEIAIAKQQKNFILSITHELKSPLAGIKLMNETLKMRELPKEKQHTLINNALSEVDRLESLVENILIAAKIENDQYGFTKEKINLSTICEQVFINYKERKDIQMSASIEEDVYLEADKTCMASILSNLIDNAIKYAENSKVHLSLQKNNQSIQLLVSDEGKGIPDTEKSKIFDKFYRIGNEETRAAKGTGLGLYIVKQLVNFHKGSIEVKNNQPCGTQFIITF
jgi:two-component system, OmpR family, phosphate regulon sensor histidine kinase PhoR